MKIILTSLNSKYIHSSLGVWYLYSVYLQESNGNIVDVYENTINAPMNSIVADLIAKKADIIGFSCYIWNIEYIKRISEKIKKISPEIKIFLGGPQATHDCDSLIETGFFDYIIKGEGEHPFREMLIGNFSNFNKIIEYPVDNIEYYNPYTQKYFEQLNGRIAYIETSRGCPFSCSFCLSGRNESVRFFDIEASKENIIKLANSGTQTVKFVDRTFNCNDKRAKEIFEFIVESKCEGKIKDNVIFHFEIEAELFSKETLDYLACVPKGLFQFEAGLQSFNKQTLEAVSRKCDIVALVNNLKRIAENKNIHLHIDLIAGLPHEGLDQFIDGFNLAYKINANVIQLGFLKLLHGSQLKNEALEHGYIYDSFPPYEILFNNSISYLHIQDLKMVEDAVERIYNSQRFKFTLKYMLSVNEFTPYQLFYAIGSYIQNLNEPSQSLDKYTESLTAAAMKIKGIDPKMLRDVIVMDRITTDKTGKLFSHLAVKDERLKAINNILKQNIIEVFENQGDKSRSAKIGFAILYAQEEEQVVFADYDCYDSVNNIYDYKILPMKLFDNTKI